MQLRIATNADAVYVWGSQLEAGDVVTSYIKTTTVAASRIADALSYTGVPASNETRMRIDGTTNYDVNNWDGIAPAPAVPKVVNSIKVYLPAQRPA